ncbi:MAG TPA: FecR family protein [Polyangiaceae bacterium]|jgi:transmembrane sensor|nr:FecR family protein [Polyangiaceae bacterium]
MTAPAGPVKPLPIASSIVARWGHDRRERLLAAVHARRAQRAHNRRRALVVALLFTVLLGTGVAWRFRSRSGAAVATVSGQEVRFGDGSSVRLLDAEAALDIGSASTTLVEVTLRAGSAQFAITPNPSRRFVVHAGAADVSVLGTQFKVTRDADRVRVEVNHGRVLVRYLGGSRLLTDGESNWFPPVELAEPMPVPSTPTASPSPASASPLPSKPSSEARPERRRFLEHASRGEYADAYAAMERTPDVVGDEASDLLRAADAARYSGHPMEATRYLERVVRERAHESVAPLAAFTLGRIELSQLGQPAKAADAFARAFDLAPNGSLAEDALAREAEAAGLAGQRDRARQVRAQYLERFPRGRRAESIREAAGMSDNPVRGR